MQNLINRGNTITLLIFNLLGLAVCLSEPFSRHCVKALLFLAVVRCFMEPKVLSKLIRIRKLLLAVALFVTVMFVSCIYGGDFWNQVSSYKFLMHYNALLMPVCVVLLDKEISVKKVMYAAFIGLMVTNIYMIYQSFSGVARPASFLKGTIMLGTMLYVILIPAMTVFSVNKELSRREIVFSRCCLAVSLYAFICLNTRGAWLALFPVILYLLCTAVNSWKKRVAILGCFALLVGAGIAASPQFAQRVHSLSNSEGKEQSVNERFLMWNSAMRMGMDYPIMGVGMGNYEYEYQHNYISPEAKEPEQRHAHNNFFQFFAETGIVGLISYIVLIGTFLTWSWKRRENKYALIMFTSTLALVLYSLTDYTFAGYGGMRVYWLLMGLCITEILMAKEQWMVGENSV